MGRVSVTMGQETTTDERILGEAACWHARLAAADCTDLDRVGFQRWRAASRQHEVAFEATEALAAKISSLAQADDRLRAMADEAFAMGAGESETQLGALGASAVARRRWRARRRWMVPAALAASIFVAFVGVRVSDYLTESALPVAYSSTPQTPRDVTIVDGSVVHLDVDS